MVVRPSPLSLPRPEGQLPLLLSRDSNSSSLRSRSNRWKPPTCQRRCLILSVAWTGCSSRFTATSMRSRRSSVLQDKWQKIVSFCEIYAHLSVIIQEGEIHCFGTILCMIIMIVCLPEGNQLQGWEIPVLLPTL